MTIVLHGLEACDTCRRALRALRDADREVRFRDLRAEPLEMTEIEAWRGAFGDAVLNRRSTTWRGLTEEERSVPVAALLARHPALVKRPIVEAPDGVLHLGWTAETRAALGL